ncbi:MAG TPA: hypothetical protein DIU15_13810, partial [Deltaproteobacteria bacterium]|nr:hypothetical protein [Deltaproteobacteria bacterium]
MLPALMFLLSSLALSGVAVAACPDAEHIGDVEITDLSQLVAISDVFRTIRGSLTIGGDGIADLNGLACLERVSEALKVVNAPDLRALSLPRLSFIGGGLSLVDNAGLETVDLPSLSTLEEGDLTVRGNP